MQAYSDRDVRDIKIRYVNISLPLHDYTSLAQFVYASKLFLNSFNYGILEKSYTYMLDYNYVS